MIKSRDANRITRLMGLTIKESKNFKSNRLLRNFRRSNGISKSFAKHLISGFERILGKCKELSLGGIHVARTARQWLKRFLKVEEQFDASCNNKSS